MARNDGRIEKGQRLASAISAKAWNRAQHAADIVLGVQPGAVGDGAAYGAAPYQWVYCKNTTGATVPRWGIMQILGLEVTPTSNDGADATTQFQSMPVLTGVMPNTVTTAWCVAVEPIQNNQIGRVAVSGVVQCKIATTNQTDRFASCKVSTSELMSGPTGQALILYSDSITKWGLIRFGVGSPGIRLGKVSSTWNKGANATITEYEGDGTLKAGNVTFNALNHFSTVTVSSGAKFVACALVGATWVLIAAEC